jgi:hypothetical protein
MTAVGGVGQSSPRFLPFDDDLVGSEAVSIGGQLAVLMLESQEQRKEIDRERVESARENFRDALADEVCLLKEQADATRNGAWLEAGLVVVGAGVSIAGVVDECEVMLRVGDGISKLAQPLGAVVGTSYGAADAKGAAGLQQAAKWEIDDAREAVREAGALQDKALDWVSSLSERDAAATAAILANKA